MRKKFRFQINVADGSYVVLNSPQSFRFFFIHFDSRIVESFKLHTGIKSIFA
jgi:hypothetical protein